MKNGASILACLLLSALAGRAQVTLDLINPSAAPIVPGSTFTLNAVVNGLTSPALDAFDFTLDALPAGITLTSATSPLANWTAQESLDFPNGSPQFGGIADSPSDDVTGSAVIASFAFSVADDASSEMGVINFITPTVNEQDLQDSGGNQISFTETGAPIAVVVGTPEPSSLALAVAGLGAFALLWLRPRRCLSEAA